MLSAYDYQRQEWVQGEAAKALLISQIDQELALLRGPEGLAYWKFIKPKGHNGTYREYVRLLEGRREDILAGVYDEDRAA